MALIKKFFWNTYSLLYDTLMWFYPYMELQNVVVKELNPQKGEKILDAGCGTGNLIKILDNRFGNEIQIDAFDESQNMVALAQRKNLKHKSKITIESLNHPLPFSDDYFHKISCINVIYAVRDPNFALKELYRVSKKNGVLVLVNPKTNAGLGRLLSNHYRSAGLFKTVIILPALFFLGLFNVVIIRLARNKHFHFIPESQIKTISTEAGFEIVNQIPVYADQAMLLVLRKP